MNDYDVIIIGAGAAGLMCSIEAGKRGRRVWLIDHAKKTAEKIRISGGGRCNFTNIYTGSDRFLSQNPHFCKSALSRYTPRDFMDLVEKHGIQYHEKKLGQLFCDDSAQNIIDMLLTEASDAGVTLNMETEIKSVQPDKTGRYIVETSRGTAVCESLVIATGGLSIPKIGATKFGYDIARQFGLGIIPTRAGLVPLTFQNEILEHCKALSGVSVEADVSAGKTHFAEGLLFTHRGLSGPSILQISSYWKEGENITVNMALGHQVLDHLQKRKTENPKQEIQNTLAEILPKRLAQTICEQEKTEGRLADLSNKKLEAMAERTQNWKVKPNGTEGYRTAEVTLGGIDTKDINSKTMEARHQPGLYFIGEVLDVTGHLGGFNFQWAWSSAYTAGQYV